VSKRFVLFAIAAGAATCCKRSNACCLDFSRVAFAKASADVRAWRNQKTIADVF
jgi:hypothetical protein